MYDQDNVLPILLEYREPLWTQRARQCITENTYIDPIMAYRDGVGSMSRAFNNAYYQWKNYTNHYQFIWFVTNVTFSEDTLSSLIKVMNENPLAAVVQPTMQNSDHPFLRGSDKPKVVPFVEWTAPLIRTSALSKVGLLNDKMGYVHFDMEWCYRAKQKGFTSMVDSNSEIFHQYLHQDTSRNFWTTIRSKIRMMTINDSAAALAHTMGFKHESIITTESKAKALFK